MIGLKKQANTETRIVIIRHGNKLLSKDPGVALDARGAVMAMKFAYYFQQTYGAPDVVIAAKAASKSTNPHSLRAQQTVAPLLTLLAEQNVYPSFLHNKYPAEYKDVAQEVFNDYQGKLVLICWEHSRINKLAKALGIKQALPEWAKDNFNTVYDITLSGKTADIKILPNQYNTSFNGSFMDIVKALEGPSTALHLSDHQPVEGVQPGASFLTSFHLCLRLSSDEQPQLSTTVVQSHQRKKYN